MTEPFSLARSQTAVELGLRLVAEMDLPESSRMALRRIFSSCPPIAMYQIAESMAEQGAPWPEVEDAYLKAWEFRPPRAEPLYAIALRYRNERRYGLGYLFAKCAAEIPFPQENMLILRPDIYA